MKLFYRFLVITLSLLHSTHSSAEDLGEMLIINDTAKPPSIAETIWISAHNKISNQWEQKGINDWTWTRLSINSDPIKIPAELYDQIEVHGFAGTNSKKVDVVTCVTAPSYCDSATSQLTMKAKVDYLNDSKGFHIYQINLVHSGSIP
ncbi:MAG: hypothetical protein ACPGUD_02705 [Parashewanella sp.]